MQVSLIFLSFFIILYWLLQLGGATFIQPFAPFFETIKDITHLFYARTVKVDEATIDFSFLVATFAILFVVWGLKFVIEAIKLLETKYDMIHNYLKRKAEDLFNFVLETQHSINEYRCNNFLIFIKFSALNSAKDNRFNKDADAGVEQKQVEMLKNFHNNLDLFLPCQNKLLQGGILLYFDNFKDVDKILFQLQDIISTLKQNYEAEKWQASYLLGIEAYSNQEEIVQKVEKLIKLTNLGLKDRMVCLGEFNQRYALLNAPKCYIEGKGVYQLTKGEEEVFYVNNLR